MKNSLHDITSIAKKDFLSVQSSINSTQDKLVASIHTVKCVHNLDDSITATCVFHFMDRNDEIEASINYNTDSEGIYADAEIDEVASAVLGAMNVPIMAADGDEGTEESKDAFGFDDFDDPDFEEEMEDGEVVLEPGEDPEKEIEDPESAPDIQTDNNIENHYIVECDRCHGIFISALVESDQVVDHITGICPLCEKESDQYIKWVVKPVEFN